MMVRTDLYVWLRRCTTFPSRYLHRVATCWESEVLVVVVVVVVVGGGEHSNSTLDVRMSSGYDRNTPVDYISIVAAAITTSLIPCKVVNLLGIHSPFIHPSIHPSASTYEDPTTSSLPHYSPSTFKSSIIPHTSYLGILPVPSLVLLFGFRPVDPLADCSLPVLYLLLVHARILPGIIWLARSNTRREGEKKGERRRKVLPDPVQVQVQVQGQGGGDWISNGATK